MNSLDHVPFEDSEEVELSTEKMRVYAFTYIPDDASFREARGWLEGQLYLPVNKATRRAICMLHLEDDILAGWRADRRTARELANMRAQYPSSN